MASVSIAEAEGRLGELINTARLGEEVTITVDGLPVARLVVENIPKKPFDLATMERIASLSKPYVDPDGLSFVERLRRNDEL